jgi:hypothetical protein
MLRERPVIGAYGSVATVPAHLTCVLVPTIVEPQLSATGTNDTPLAQGPVMFFDFVYSNWWAGFDTLMGRSLLMGGARIVSPRHLVPPAKYTELGRVISVPVR